MIVAHTEAEIPPKRDVERAFIPTMGALHEGHLSLVRAAREHASEVGVSIFVNPLQFGPTEDLSRYPRPLETDLALLAGLKVDWVFVPTVEQWLGRPTTSVSVGDLGTRWEGARRPGHFDGVATIVAKLFNTVKPDVAFFGLKDYQQCCVIQKIVTDLSFPIRLELLETIREEDGLAMSSRNAYLNADERAVAPHLYKSLVAVRHSLNAKSDPESACRIASDHLSSVGFNVDYIAVVDPDTLLPATEIKGNERIIAAAQLGDTWLIDNIGL